MSDSYRGPTGRARLLRTFEKTRPDCFDDLLHCCAVTIEDGMIMSGCRPGVDYSRLDLFKLAMPLAMQLAQKNNAQVTTGVPDTHPHAGFAPPVIDNDAPIETRILELLKKHGQVTHTKLAGAFHKDGLGTRATAVAKRLCEEGKIISWKTNFSKMAPAGHTTMYGLRGRS